MTTTAGLSHRGPVTRRPPLLLLVGALVAGLVVTFLQVRAPSSAAEVNGVAVSHGQPNVALKFGAEDTCVVASRTKVSGDADRVAAIIEATSTSARQAGLLVTTYRQPTGSGTILILSQEFTLSEMGAGPASCTTEKVLEERRGRSALEMPHWARGMLAAAAAIAVYLVVVFATTTLFTFLAPEFFIYGELIGGCVGGFASTFVANLINQVPQQANLTQSAVQCVAGAILNVSLGAIKAQLVTTLRDAIHGGAVLEAVDEACSGVASGISDGISARFTESLRRFSQELAPHGP